MKVHIDKKKDFFKRIDKLKDNCERMNKEMQKNKKRK